MLAVNEVAAAFEKEFPGVLIRTLAYEYTRKPPATVMPLRNVLIQYCDIEADFGKPLDSPVNGVFGQELEQWCRISPNMRIWHYMTNFSCYMLPFPNWGAIGKDMRFFADHKVEGVFAQGSYYAGHAGDLADLRVWLVCKLMWDPKQDQDKLTDEFLNGYYGPVAPEIKQYIGIMKKAVGENPDASLRCFMTSVRSWLSRRNAEEALHLMQKAKAKAKATGDPELLKRVEAAAIPITLACFNYPGLFRNQDKARLIDELIESCRRSGATRAGESKSFDNLRHRLLFFDAIQDTGKPDFVGGRKWFGISALKGASYTAGKWVFPENDAAAFEGKALRIPYENNWVLKLQMPIDGTYEVWSAVRCDSPQPSGAAFIFGIYSPQVRKEIARKGISAKEIAGDKYVYVKIGDFCAEKGDYIFLHPLKNASVRNIWVDRFILIEK